MKTNIIGVAVLFLACGVSMGQTHAPWPADWNNWNDPAMWVTVGNPRNTGELSGVGAGGYGPDRVCGAVDYTYKIGKFEVTAGQYIQFLNAVAKTDAYGLYNTNMWTDATYGCRIQRNGSPGSYEYSVSSDWANRPVTFVSFGDAARFANWLTNGKTAGLQDLLTTEDGSYFLNGAMSNEDLVAVDRKPNAKYVVPNEDEWYKAAYYDPDKSGGAGYWNYPTGTDTMPSNDLVNPDGGNNANFYYDHWTLGSPYYRTVAGDFENSESAYGTFDQGGNVWEWNEAAMSSVSRGERGGSFRGTQSGAADWLHASVRSSTGASIDAGSMGFRIAEVPEPATLAFLSLGGLVMLRKRNISRTARKGAEQ
jgi:formylglycine-generating enzyme required for sulfatase activity